VGTVSFIESFHWCLGFEGRACVNGLSGQGRFHCHVSTSQWPSPLPRVNTAQRHSSFLCRSHVAHHAKHSANKHRGMPRGAAQRLYWAACQKQSARRSGNSTTHTPSSGLAVRLARPAHQSLPCTFMLGYTGLNCQQSKHRAMSWPCNRQASAPVSRPRPSVVRWLRAPG
jgi:hypothetical protein